jgi:tetratricopeptide (TPR) repeat protein
MQEIRLTILLALTFVATAVSAQSGSSYRELTDRAMSCIAADSLSEAESLIQEAMKLEPTNPSNAMLFANLGQVQRRLGKTEKAIDSYSYAVNMMPRNVSVALDRAALYLELGKATPAIYDYNRVLDLEPDNEEALSMRAYAYMSKREFSLAQADYNHLLRLKPNDYNTMLGLTTLLQQEMKYRDALEMVNRMMVSYPDDALLLTVRADIERETKHDDLALTDLDRAIELNPQLTDAYLLRGDIYLLQNKRHLARADFEKAISLGVPQSQLHDRLMMVK